MDLYGSIYGNACGMRSCSLIKNQLGTVCVLVGGDSYEQLSFVFISRIFFPLCVADWLSETHRDLDFEMLEENVLTGLFKEFYFAVRTKKIKGTLGRPTRAYAWPTKAPRRKNNVQPGVKHVLHVR